MILHNKFQRLVIGDWPHKCSSLIVKFLGYDIYFGRKPSSELIYKVSSLLINKIFYFKHCETSVSETPHQDGDDAFELLLHQVTDDLVVEVLHRLPLQTHKQHSVKINTIMGIN